MARWRLLQGVAAALLALLFAGRIAESVRALDYVQQRSHQESQSLTMLARQMERFGVTVTPGWLGMSIGGCAVLKPLSPAASALPVPEARTPATNAVHASVVRRLMLTPESCEAGLTDRAGRR
jgi:hypothetical protein